MTKTLQTTVVLLLVVLLLALAVPALGATDQIVTETPSSEGILTSPGIDSGTIALVQDLDPTPPAYGGRLNLLD